MLQQDQKKAGIILSYLNLFLNLLIQLLYTPIMLSLLGQSEYGLYTLVNSTISYMTLFDLGFSGSYLRFYSEYTAKKDKEQIAILNGTFIKLTLVLSAIAIGCGLLLSINIDGIFKQSLSIEELNKAKKMMFILSFGIGFTLLSNVWNSIINAHEKFVVQKIVQLFQILCNPFIALPLMLMGFGSVSIAVASLSSSIFGLIFNSCFAIKRLNVKVKITKTNRQLLRRIRNFSAFVFLNEIISQLNWNIDKVLLGYFSGTVMTAIYGVGSQIDVIYRSLSSSVSAVFAPLVNRIVAVSDDNKALSDVFIKVGRIQFIILYPILVGFITYGQYFIKLWAGDEYYLSYWVALLLIIPVSVPLIQNIGIDIQMAKNKHQFRSVVYLFIAVLNFCISVPLCKRYGAIGCAVGTAIALVLGNIVIMNFYYQHEIGLDILSFWKNIFSFWKGLLPATLFSVLTLLVKPNWNIGAYLLSITIFVIIYLVFMWKIGINEYEKGIVLSTIKKITKRD